MKMTEQLEEDACLYALEALPQAEHAQFEADLSQNSALRELVRNFRSATDALALAAAARLNAKPPPQLKQKILSQIGTNRPRKHHDGFFSLVQASLLPWIPSGIPGCSKKVLARNARYSMVLARMEPGARFPSHRHPESEDCFILEGDFRVHGEVLGPGDFHHADAGSTHGEISTEGGCTCLIVTGVPPDPVPK